MIKKIVVVFVLALCCQPCLQSPLAAGENASPFQDDDGKDSDDVRELESLRSISTMSKANNTEMAKPETFPLRETLEPLPTPLPVSDAPQANSRSGIFRHRGITEAKKSYWKGKPLHTTDGDYRYVGLQYSPIDLAIYVYNTGDEEGVAVAVEELVREGMMGRTDAINYLQDVKQVLSFLKDECIQRKSMDDFKNRAYPKPEITQRVPNPPREQFISAMDLKKRDPPTAATSSLVTTEHPREAVIASTSEPKSPVHSPSTTSSPKSSASVDESVEEDPRKHDMETPYSNEDMKRRDSAISSDAFPQQIVYKLAKEMFTKSILRDDPTAEDTLAGLMAFLEMEVGNNRISQEMKQQILEVVSAALVDSMKEYQNYMQLNQINQEPPLDDSGLYHKSKSGNPGPQVPIAEMYRKLAAEGHENNPYNIKNNRPNAS